MWRSRSLEEWERKKSYLIRSLFEDVPILSPILERDEPSSLSSPSNFVYRADSPLPELIIEVEPKKPNLHDDPEELYDALAKQMRRLYRKDFLDIELSTSCSEKSSSEIVNRGRIYDKVSSVESDSDEALGKNGLKDKSQIDYDGTEYLVDNDINSSTQTEPSTSKKSSETIHIASELLITQVDVHSQEWLIRENLAFEREQQRFTESKQCRQSGEYSINLSKTSNGIESINGGDDEDDDTDKEESSVSECFAKDANASSSDSSSDSSLNSSHDSPEIMRQRQPSESFETPPHRPVSKSNSTVCKTINLSMEMDSKEFTEEFLASNQEVEIAKDSVNETIFFVTSTPTRKRTSARLSTKRGHKKRLVSYSSSSSFASVANVALQTSFSDCETDWCSFWSKFFVGMPTVFNVCSCYDHVCNT